MDYVKMLENRIEDLKAVKKHLENELDNIISEIDDLEVEIVRLENT